MRSSVKSATRTAIFLVEPQSGVGNTQPIKGIILSSCLFASTNQYFRLLPQVKARTMHRVFHESLPLLAISQPAIELYLLNDWIHPFACAEGHAVSHISC